MQRTCTLCLHITKHLSLMSPILYGRYHATIERSNRKLITAYGRLIPASTADDQKDEGSERSKMGRDDQRIRGVR